MQLKQFFYLLPIVFLSGFLALSSCTQNDDDDPDPQIETTASCMISYNGNNYGFEGFGGGRVVPDYPDAFFDGTQLDTIVYDAALVVSISDFVTALSDQQALTLVIANYTGTGTYNFLDFSDREAGGVLTLGYLKTNANVPETGFGAYHILREDMDVTVTITKDNSSGVEGTFVAEVPELDDDGNFTGLNTMQGSFTGEKME